MLTNGFTTFTVHLVFQCDEFERNHYSVSYLPIISKPAYIMGLGQQLAYSLTICLIGYLQAESQSTPSVPQEWTMPHRYF